MGGAGAKQLLLGLDAATLRQHLPVAARHGLYAGAREPPLCAQAASKNSQNMKLKRWGMELDPLSHHTYNDL